MPWTVYLLRCANGDLYTGITTDLARRLHEHRLGIGGKFTRSFGVVELAYSEQLPTESGARRRERQIKSWSRAKKLALVAGDLAVLKRA